MSTAITVFTSNYKISAFRKLMVHIMRITWLKVKSDFMAGVVCSGFVDAAITNADAIFIIYCSRQLKALKHKTRNRKCNATCSYLCMCWHLDTL